jgi:hypothetical protein
MSNPKWKSVVALASLLLSVLASYPFELANITDSSCITVAQYTMCEGYSNHGCTSTNFYVEHGGTYYVTASIDNCGGGGCSGCVSEAYIYESTSMGTCIHSACCDAESTTVDLSGGHTYTLYCCLLPCEQGQNCSTACSNCPARAIVHA